LYQSNGLVVNLAYTEIDCAPNITELPASAVAGIIVGVILFLIVVTLILVILFVPRAKKAVKKLFRKQQMEEFIVDAPSNSMRH